MNERIYLSPPFMGGNEKKYIEQAFEKNYIAPLGENVTEFERRAAAYVNLPSAAALSSGTAAIHLALLCLDVKPDDFVFCSDFTFIGSCGPIHHMLAKPVFIDSEPLSLNMSPIALEKAFAHFSKMNKLPKAVIIVDLYGQSADYDALTNICERYGVPVIEDSAEALGARYKDKPCGSFGSVSVFSFNGNKIVTTSGGGMALSRDPNLIKKIFFLATQAREPFRHYEHEVCGFNYRLSNISASIGLGQLDILDYKLKRRRDIFSVYKTLFNDSTLSMMPIAEYGSPNYWLSVISGDDGIDVNKILDALAAENIEARPTWKPMHEQPVFKDCLAFSHYDNEFFDSVYFRRSLCLPSGESLKEEEQEVIAEIVKDNA